MAPPDAAARRAVRKPPASRVGSRRPGANVFLPESITTRRPAARVPCRHTRVVQFGREI